jgi:hypothetical protein
MIKNTVCLKILFNAKCLSLIQISCKKEINLLHINFLKQLIWINNIYRILRIIFLLFLSKKLIFIYLYFLFLRSNGMFKNNHGCKIFT